MTPPLTISFCTYNRAGRLPLLVRTLRAQHCTEPFEILAINNNSTDSTVPLLPSLAGEQGAPLRFVTEIRPGIVFARNRAISECLGREYMIFIDDDALPRPGLVQAAFEQLSRSADVVGGRTLLDLPNKKPRWLTLSDERVRLSMQLANSIGVIRGMQRALVENKKR